MCTLIVVKGKSSEYPVVIAGNRDEFFRRPTRSPGYHFPNTGIFAGYDEVGHGTWMGVNRNGLACGLVNQRIPRTETSKRSRGKIVTDVLACQSLDAALSYLRSLNPSDFNPFHLCLTDGRDVYIMRGTDVPFIEPVKDGVWVLTNEGLDADAYPKVRRIQAQFTIPEDAELHLVSTLKEILADTWYPDSSSLTESFARPDDIERRLHAVCVRTPLYGTRSSTILGVGEAQIRLYLHADGPPDQTDFRDLTTKLAAHLTHSG